ERSGELRLAEEPLTELIVESELWRDHLQRDSAREPPVCCQVDRAHSAPPEQRLDRVVAERLADAGREPFSHDRSASGNRADARSRSDALRRTAPTSSSAPTRAWPTLPVYASAPPSTRHASTRRAYRASGLRRWRRFAPPGSEPAGAPGR